jgi:hypothetical protein
MFCTTMTHEWWAEGSDILTTDEDGLPVLVVRVYNELDVDIVLSALRASDADGGGL